MVHHGLSFTFREDLAPLLQRAGDSTFVEDMQVVAGEGAADCLRDHFMLLEQTRPNKNNWPRQHFWAAAYKAVQNPTRAGDDVVVSINHIGLAQRFFGGWIRPVSAEMLTIPAAPQAYGKRAREFPYLTFGFAQNPRTGKMQPALMEAMRTEVRIGKKKKDGTRSVTPTQTILGGGVLFWLTPAVFQEKDETVLPTEEKLANAAVSAGLSFLERRLGPSGGTTN